jgi:hypothetical protein
MAAPKRVSQKVTMQKVTMKRRAGPTAPKKKGRVIKRGVNPEQY